MVCDASNRCNRGGSASLISLLKDLARFSRKHHAK